METNLQQEPCGVLIIDKPQGMTSHDVVGKIRRLFGTRRVGHTGTLDPLATGVLVVLIGRAAKASEYLSSHRKAYIATLKLGITTDTEDISGKVLSTSSALPSQEEVFQLLPRFRGEIEQIPPMYSALKVGGRKLVDLARKGEVIEREARKINIFALEASATQVPEEYTLEVSCSGGTYIRTLCADIGLALGCGGVMSSLRRTEVEGFSIAVAHSLEELETLTIEERTSLLYPVESLFKEYPLLTLGAFHEKLIRSGCTVETGKLGVKNAAVGQRFRLANEAAHFFALGEVLEDGIKSIKLFELE